MPKTLLRLLPAAVCLLPSLLFAAAQFSSPSATPDDRANDSYTVQAGDTLVGIARRLGLTPDALVKANALDRPDKIIVGNVLRLPVTPPGPAQAPAVQPAPPQVSPVQTSAAAKPAATETVSAAPRPDAPQPAAPAQAKTPTPPQAPAEPAADVAAPAALAPPPKTASASPAMAEPPQAQSALAESPAKAADATEAAVRLAIGTYANPTLGTLRVSQTPTGIAVSRDNKTIAMRHLLYAVFDGVDTTGDVHGLRLQYDDAGQVRALLYSSASGKDIPFTRVKK